MKNIKLNFLILIVSFLTLSSLVIFNDSLFGQPRTGDISIINHEPVTNSQNFNVTFRMNIQMRNLTWRTRSGNNYSTYRSIPGLFPYGSRQTINIGTIENTRKTLEFSYEDVIRRSWKKLKFYYQLVDDQPSFTIIQLR